MERKDFPKETKPREIFVYTLERIAEPLPPLCRKYRKSKMERERSIQEIFGQIQEYALPFFARFSDLRTLLDDVEREGFFLHRKGVD